MVEDNEKKIEEQQKVIEELKSHVARFEKVEHDLRTTQGKLDSQIDNYSRIHDYTLLAFSNEEEELYNVIAEGVVDIFQVEISMVYRFDFELNRLVLVGGCNNENMYESIPISTDDDWILEWNDSWEKAKYESPVSNSAFKDKGLSSILIYTMLNNKKQPEGFIVGAITTESSQFYQFSPEISMSSFNVYCQQMNGISNNFDAISQAKDAGAAKSRFLANLSHEIRTPMNAILGMAKIAEHSDDRDEIMDCIKKIDTSSHHLLSLINDVLDISKVEEGKLSLAHEPFDISQSIENVLSNIMPTVKEKSQKFTIHKESLTVRGLIGDSMRLTQVLLNLLSNAIKFTDDNGEIVLDIEQLKLEEAKVLIKFSVTDTGIGIDEEHLDAIFSPFVQADGSISRKYGGTGLGLAISQRIVELMDGQIIVDSEKNKGTSFQFTIWFDIDEESSSWSEDKYEEDYSQVNLDGAKILVVDDVSINREIIQAFLEDVGAQIVNAENGQEAVDIFNRSKPEEFSLVLMDIQMPVMDGCSATEIIRKLSRPDAKTIPIYAMTANVFKEDVQSVINAGMNGHIGKPVDYNIVMKTTLDAVEKNRNKD